MIHISKEKRLSTMTKFVTDKINSKKVEQYIDKCYKNW